MWHRVTIVNVQLTVPQKDFLTGVTVEPASLVPNGFEVTWYDDFNGNDINRTNWVVGR